MKCPNCGANSKSAYCEACGYRVSSKAARSSSRKYAIAGAVAAACLIGFLFVVLGRRESNDVVDTERPDSLPTGEVTRIQADRVYERVVAAQARGDSAEANALIPTALQAYSLAGDLDSDAMYHATLLFIASGDLKAARDAAEQVLTEMPNDPFALAAAGKAARLQGDTLAATKYYGRFLAVYPAESKRMEYPEQLHHGSTLPALKADAEAYVR